MKKIFDKKVEQSSTKQKLMKNKILMVIMFGAILFSMTSVLALESQGTFKQGDCMNISQTCASCSYVNLSSVSSQNNSDLVNNVEMVFLGNGEWRYEFCDTDFIGRYDVKGQGDKDGVDSSFASYFEVTPNGVTQTQANAMGSLGFLILMIVLMISFGIVGIKLLKTEKFWILGIFLVFLAVLLMIYNTWLGYEYHHLLTGLPDSAVPETIFYIFLMILVAGLFGAIILLILNWKKLFKYFKQQVKKKDKEDSDVEDWDFDTWGGKGDYGK